MQLRSQKVRALAPESDPLKIGMDWTPADLEKPPQIKRYAQHAVIPMKGAYMGK